MNKFFATAIAIISLVPAIASLTIDTPASMTQCQPTLFTWNGGTEPYFLSVLPGGQISAPPIVALGQIGGTSQTWVVTLPPNVQYTIVLKDSTGQQAFTDQVTVLPSTDQSCMNASSTAASNDAPSMAVGSGTGAAGATHTTQGSTGAAQGSANKASARPSAAASNVSNSGTVVGAGSFGIASILGLVGVVLF